MTSRILLVATSKQMAEKGKVLSNNTKIDIDIYYGGINKGGVLYALENQDKYDVIISQGNTAQSIESKVNIPVVFIELSTTNLLKALKQAKGNGGKIGLIFYENEKLLELEKVKDILNVDYQLFTYGDALEMNKKFINSIKDGINTIIGIGDCIFDSPESKNINTIILQSNASDIRAALVTAKNIVDWGVKERGKNELLKNIIDYSGDGIVALSIEGKVITCNPVAEKILDIKFKNVYNEKLINLLTTETYSLFVGEDNAFFNKLIEIQQKQFLMNKLPIIINGKVLSIVYTFQAVSRIKELEQKARTQLFKRGFVAKYNFETIISTSESMLKSINKAKLFSKSDSTVLITAETGTGKELFAQSIHNCSDRIHLPFVALNCAAMPESLLESELFGYVGGAFTGARKDGKPGMFEIAHNGTIFLDEISDLPLNLQGRLLRIIQEKEVFRIGGDYVLEVDVRIIAASNKNLKELVESGKFRQDLYYRLNVLELTIPPLRERYEDIPLLVHTFLERMNIKYGKKIIGLHDECIHILKKYNWPGNVRELENFIERVTLMSNVEIVQKELLKKLLPINEFNHHENSISVQDTHSNHEIRLELGTLKSIELQAINEALNLYGSDRTKLAEMLGISRTTLWKKINELENNN